MIQLAMNGGVPHLFCLQPTRKPPPYGWCFYCSAMSSRDARTERRIVSGYLRQSTLESQLENGELVFVDPDAVSFEVRHTLYLRLYDVARRDSAKFVLDDLRDCALRFGLEGIL